MASRDLLGNQRLKCTQWSSNRQRKVIGKQITGGVWLDAVNPDDFQNKE